MYMIDVFAKRVGVVPKTVQRWDCEGRLKEHRMVTNQRSSTEEDLAVVLGLVPPVNQKRCVVSGRVSSPAQQSDLVKQRQHLEQFCTACGQVVDEWIEAIGSGLNVELQQLLASVDRIIADSVGMLVLAHQDRLVRFGFALDLASVCQAPVRTPGAEPAVAEAGTSTQAGCAHPAARIFKSVGQLAELPQYVEGDVGPWQRH